MSKVYGLNRIADDIFRNQREMIVNKSTSNLCDVFFEKYVDNTKTDDLKNNGHIADEYNFVIENLVKDGFKCGFIAAIDLIMEIEDTKTMRGEQED